MSVSFVECGFVGDSHYLDMQTPKMASSLHLPFVDMQTPIMASKFVLGTNGWPTALNFHCVCGCGGRGRGRYLGTD